MLTILFTVYDSKANAYLPPFYLPSEGQARRTFGDCANDKNHQFGLHPSDYTLYRLGTFNDQNAQFEITDPISMGNGIEYVVDKDEESLTLKEVL